MKDIKKRNGRAVGAFFDVTVNATVNELTALFGEPNHHADDESEKTIDEWEFSGIKDGVRKECSLYSWKEYRQYGPEETICWHIGAKDKETCEQFKQGLEDLLSAYRGPWPTDIAEGFLQRAHDLKKEVLEKLRFELTRHGVDHIDFTECDDCPIIVEGDEDETTYTLDDLRLKDGKLTFYCSSCYSSASVTENTISLDAAIETYRVLASHPFLIHGDDEIEDAQQY